MIATINLLEGDFLVRGRGTFCGIVFLAFFILLLVGVVLALLVVFGLARLLVLAVVGEVFPLVFAIVLPAWVWFRIGFVCLLFATALISFLLT